MKEILSKLNIILDRRQKIGIFYLLGFMVLAAGLEAIGVGLIFPIVEMVSRPDYLTIHPNVEKVTKWCGIVDRGSLVLYSSVLLLVAFFVKNTLLAGIHFFQNRFIYSNQVILARRIFKHFLYSSYISLIDRNPVEIVRAVNGDPAYIFQNIVTSFLMVASEGLIVCAVFALLCFVDPVSTITALAIQGSIAAFIYLNVKGRLSVLGKAQQEHLNAMMKWVNQGLGGIKETKVTGSQNYFLSQYEAQANLYIRSERWLASLTQLPRLILETLAIGTLTIIIGIFIFQKRDLSLLAPTLAAFAMSAFRLLPAITRILTSLNLIQYFQASVHTVERELKGISGAPLISATDIPKRSRESSPEVGFFDFFDVSFTYPGRVVPAISGLNFSIEKNSTIAFVGQSGAGKTTLVDLLLGLLEPSSGQVRADSVDIELDIAGWQRRVGYVPQNIYLTDDTIRSNIAFGLDVSQQSDDLIWQVLDWVQLKHFVSGLPNGLDTQVGDRGVRLSGGQRQRIGIARALYRNPEILVLDEATSSLDVTTEQEVMEAILGLKGKRTLVIVTHRLSTIQNSDTVFFLKHGRIQDHGTFDQLVANNSEFSAMAKKARISQ